MVNRIKKNKKCVHRLVKNFKDKENNQEFN